MFIKFDASKYFVGLVLGEYSQAFLGVGSAVDLEMGGVQLKDCLISQKFWHAEHFAFAQGERNSVTFLIIYRVYIIIFSILHILWKVL